MSKYDIKDAHLTVLIKGGSDFSHGMTTYFSRKRMNA